MSANELVIVARLANHYEKHVSEGQDPLEVATHDFKKFKRDAPKLWRFLHKSELSDRKIADLLYELFIRHSESGMSFKNFAADELERLEA